MEQAKEDKLVEWLEMTEEERRKYNGYNGFLKGELFKDNNLFMEEDKMRLQRRLVKEKALRIRHQLKKKEEEDGK